MGRAVHDEHFFIRAGNLLVQPLVVRQRHAPVRRAAHQQHGDVPQAGHRTADVQGIDFQAHPEFRDGTRQKPEGHRGQAEHPLQVAAQRFGGRVETAFGDDGVDPGFLRRREQRGGSAHGNPPEDHRSPLAPLVHHVPQGRLRVAPLVIAEGRQVALAVPVAAEIEQDPPEPVFVQEGRLVEHLAPVVEMAVAVDDRAPTGFVRDVPGGQVQPIGRGQRHLFVGQPIVRGRVLRLATRSHATGVQGRYEVGQRDEDEQKNDHNAHGGASIGDLSAAHGQGQYRPDQRARDEGNDRPKYGVGDDQAEEDAASPGEVFAIEPGRLAQNGQEHDQQTDAGRIEQRRGKEPAVPSAGAETDDGEPGGGGRNGPVDAEGTARHEVRDVQQEPQDDQAPGNDQGQADERQRHGRPRAASWSCPGLLSAR